jgi:hypothetical protein
MLAHMCISSTILSPKKESSAVKAESSVKKGIFLCMYIACMYIHIYIYIYKYIHMYIYTYTCTYHICTYIYTYKYL